MKFPNFLSEQSDRNQPLIKRTGRVLEGSIILFAVAFLLALIIIVGRNVRDNNISKSDTLLNSVSGSISANMLTYKDISRLVMLNDAVTVFLRADEVDSGLRNDAKYGVMDVIIVCSGVDSVFIFRNDRAYMNTGRGEYFVDSELMEDSSWQNTVLSLRGGALVTLNGNGAITRRNGTPIISIGRAIYDINTQKQVGLMELNISTLMLEQIVQGQEAEIVSIVAEDGTYLAGDEELAKLYTPEYYTNTIVHNNKKLGKRRTMVSGVQVDDMPFVVMCATSQKMTSIPVETVLVMAIILAAFSIAFGMSATFVTNNITKPVNELSNAMEETRKTGYLQKIDVNLPKNELGNLAENYNSMIESLNELFKELIEKEKSVQKAEMRVLHEQLKPHFLYNSLETISYMAFDAGAKDVHEALETLGSFYRNFLSKGEREIPLKTEINIIKNYLSLQKLRYGDIINDEYDIAEDTLELRIPKLILQPLVENSIYHGIRLTGEPGTITVRTRLEGRNLHIVVHDTGIGMTQEAIDRVLSFEPSENTEESKHSSFGLKGTIERIRYYCNNDDVVTIRSEVGEYTEIELVISNIIAERGMENVQSNADR